MRVRISIGLDFDGIHTFDWEPSEAPGAIDIPKTTLERWSKERESFTIASLRWKRVVEEIEDSLLKAEETEKSRKDHVVAVLAATPRS
jgi:hypothetical protein